MNPRAVLLAVLMALPTTVLAFGVAQAQTIYHYQSPSGTVHLSDIKTTQEYRPYFLFRLPATMDRSEIAACILRSAKNWGVDPALVTAMVEVESGFSVRAVSPKGAQGLMQIMPATAKDLKLTDSFDAQKNIDAGTRYLRQMLDRFKGDPKLALAAYNAGPGAVERAGGVPPYAETQKYIEKVRSKLGRAL